MKNVLIVVIIIITFGILVFNHLFFEPFAEPSIIIEKLNDLQKEILKNLNDRTNLLISLSTAIFGLIGYFALESYKLNRKIDEKLKIDLILTLVLTILSIDFGYISMEKLIEMLSLGIFSPFDNLIRLPKVFQLLTFLLSIFFSGSLVYKLMFNSKQLSL